MNNLKRVLSLALSGIMLVGMMAMGASAADFTDADTIEHDDAVNVLVALKVINGQDDGSFNPTGDVTRGQMAKMIAVAMNGGNDASTGVKSTPTFTDIKGHWAESYIEYCSDLGIISGRGDGTFDPDGNVTGFEATKMVLTALGYDAKSYELEGAKWATQTDQLARQASPALYEELTGVAMINKASRDTAAQLIWNGLQNRTVRPSPDQDRTNKGEVTWSYQKTEQTLLEERYDGQIWLGVYEGNSKSLNGVDEGNIRINKAGKESVEESSRNGSATFPSDLGIENIGEEVKVVFKDGKGGTPNKPDKKDTIYGVFNTHKTEVYNVTKSQLQDAKDDSVDTIKFGDTKYDAKGTDNKITVVTNYVGSGAAEAIADFSSSDKYRVQSKDQIKFVCDGDGKITAAYIVEVDAGKVASVTSSKVTISGVGAIDIKDNNIYEGIAKDDVVVYTKFYKTDKDDAFFTVTKAESVEGELTGYKRTSNESSDNYDNVVVDGTTYKVNEKTLKELSDDPITKPEPKNVGDTVRLFLIDGFAAGIQSIEKTGGNYALVTEVSDGSNGIGNNIDPLRITVLLADGTEQTVTVHKDSTYDGTDTKIVDGVPAKADQEALFAKAKKDVDDAVLIEYTSITNGSIKIKEIFNKNTQIIETTKDLWDKDAKALGYGVKTYVAASDAVLFVGVDAKNGASEGQDNKAEDFKAYELRGLGNIKTDKMSNGKKVVAVINDDGLVEAAYAMLVMKPGSNTAETLYGMVTGYVGRRNNADGDTLYRYTVAVNRDKEVEISVNDRSLPDGTLVKFDEAANGEYDIGTDLLVLPEDEGGWQLGAVKSYSESNRLLSYYTATEKVGNVFEGKGKAASYTVDKDVKLVYVNTADGEDGAAIGVTSFNDDKGNANVFFHVDTDGVVDVIFVETSDAKMKPQTDNSVFGQPGQG